MLPSARWPSGRRYLFTSRAVLEDFGSNLGQIKLYVSGLKVVGLKHNSAAPKTEESHEWHSSWGKAILYEDFCCGADLAISTVAFWTKAFLKKNFFRYNKSLNLRRKAF